MSHFTGAVPVQAFFMFDNLFRFSLCQLQTVGLYMTMRASQFPSPWCMSGNGKFFKTWIKGPMTIRTKVFKLLSIVKHH